MAHIQLSSRNPVILVVATLLVALTAVAAEVRAASAQARPFDVLTGWWIGHGRLGFKDGKTENVKCRATYTLTNTKGTKLRQVVRCASASGKIEVESIVSYDGKALGGEWRERTYNVAGSLKGDLIPGGFRVAVTGQQLNAEMTIAVRQNRHVVEIRFVNNTLLGLSMIFGRG